MTAIKNLVIYNFFLLTAELYLKSSEMITFKRVGINLILDRLELNLKMFTEKKFIYYFVYLYFQKKSLV